MIKKLILSILIILSIFNCITPTNFVFATDESESKKETFGEVMNGVPEDSMDSMLNDGESTASPNGSATKRKIQSSPSFGGATASALAKIFIIIPSIMNLIMNVVINSQQSLGTGNEEFTIYNLLQNDYDVFNINFFDTSSATSNARKLIGENVAVWYYGVRNLAVALSLLILIYVGIRMAGSTLAPDKAKYKEMALHWVKGFCLIFVMQYVILFSINLSNALVDIIPDSTDNIESAIVHGDGGTGNNPTKDSIQYKLQTMKGWNYVAVVVLYFVIVYYQFKFFILYFKRVISIGFMTIISPLVSITYPIDSISDGKAQGFNKWLKELLVSIFIQPIHLIIYSVVIVCAGAIIEVAPVLAILFFIGLSRAEKVVKNVLGIRDQKSLSSLGSMKIQHRA